MMKSKERTVTVRLVESDKVHNYNLLVEQLAKKICS